MRNEKGQGALEYLLLIGGAVLVAAIVIVLLLGINQQSGTQTNATAAAGLCNTKTAGAFPTSPTAYCNATGVFGGGIVQIMTSPAYYCCKATQLPSCKATTSADGTTNC